MKLNEKYGNPEEYLRRLAGELGKAAQDVDRITSRCHEVEFILDHIVSNALQAHAREMCRLVGELQIFADFSCRDHRDQKESKA